MAKLCIYGAKAAREAIHTRAAALRGQIERVQREDVDGVHDMRVASRRLRKALGECRPYFVKQVRKRVQTRVRSITQSLGRPRELDVMIGMLQRHGEAAHDGLKPALKEAVAILHSRRQAVAERCHEAARLASVPEFETDLEALLQAQAPQACYVEDAADSLAAHFKGLCHRHEDWRGSGGDNALHQLRIAFKKTRYAAELYTPLYGEGLANLVQHLKATQDLLGDWNDFRVLRDELSSARDRAALRHEDAFNELIQTFDRQSDSLKDTFRDRARDFFAKDERTAALRLLRSPKVSCCHRP